MLYVDCMGKGVVLFYLNGRGFRLSIRLIHIFIYI